MSCGGVQFQDLPYRDMEKLRQVGSHRLSAPTQSTVETRSIHWGQTLSKMSRQVVIWRDCFALLRDEGHNSNHQSRLSSRHHASSTHALTKSKPAVSICIMREAFFLLYSMHICFSGSQRLDQSYSSYAHFHPSLGQLSSVCLNVSDFTITADSFVIIIVLHHVTPLCPFCDLPLPGTFTPGRSSSLSSGLPDSRWSSDECTTFAERSTTGPSSQGCRTQPPISKTSSSRAACWTCALK